MTDVPTIVALSGVVAAAIAGPPLVQRRRGRSSEQRHRHVRVHLQVHPPSGEYDGTMTMEGFFTGRQPVCDDAHGEATFVLERPKIIESETRLDLENRGAVKVSLEARSGDLPARRVVFVEVLAVDGVR